MRSLSNVGLGLSLVCGCLFLALIAEIYYLLWWKKRFTTNNTETEEGKSIKFSTRDLLYMFCWKKSSSLHSTAALSARDLGSSLSLNQHISGPPKFLFPIKEETKEDLESEEGESRRGDKRSRSLSDIVVTVETPFLTPLASPPYLTPPLSPRELSFASELPKDEDDEEEEGSFITLVVSRNKVEVPKYNCSSSQVLPLASSPKIQHWDIQLTRNSARI